MSATAIPSIEERLRSSLVLCDALKYTALLADENPLVTVPAFTPREVLKLIPPALGVLSAQLLAARAALSADALNTHAPAKAGTR